MKWRRLFAGLLTTLLCSLTAPGADASPADGARFFEEKVRPVLEQRCFECHSQQSGKMKGGLTLDSRNGWATGGDTGPALVPGAPEKSLLIKAIRRTDPELKMPPKQALTEAEVAVLVEWVQSGAPDPRTTAPIASNTPASTAEWWSLRPLQHPALPTAKGHPIDAFIDWARRWQPPPQWQQRYTEEYSI